MRISVIVPSYRRPEKLKNCVKSLLAQTEQPCEIVIGLRRDDYRTIAAAEELSAQSPLVTTAYVDVPGFLPPLNAALEKARGEIVCFMDDDAAAPPEYLKKIAAHYSDPRVVGVGGIIVDYTDMPETKKITPRGGRINWFGRTHVFTPDITAVQEADFITGAAMSFLRAALKPVDLNLNCGNASGYEIDVSFTAKKYFKKSKIIYDPTIHLQHYPTSEQIIGKTSRENLYAYAHNLAYLVMKHLPWPRKIAFLIYIYAVGQWNCPGLVTGFLSLFSANARKKLLRSVPATLRGRWDAILLYLFR